MPITIKQIIFSLLFFCSWFLTLLLGESYLGYLLMGVVVVLMLFFFHQLEWRRLFRHKYIVILWIIFLIGVVLSAVFTVSIPLTLYEVSRLLFLTLSFWFFLLVSDSLITGPQFVGLVLLTTSVVVVWSVVFLFVPDWGELLPKMNLLYATYGHSHIAALLLLVLPLSWWFASKYDKEKQSFVWWILPLVFTIALFVSFGRVAIVIGFLQFLFVYQSLRKSSFLSGRAFKVLKVLGMLFSLVVIGQIFLSTIAWVKPDFGCPIPRLESQLCKVIITEPRPHYWYWALEILKDNLWFGSGPGTFAISSEKYHLNTLIPASYAHNAFFQFLAEMGLVGGGAFLVLMWGLLWAAWSHLKKNWRWSWQIAAFIGVVSIYLDVLLDFDWNFLGIFSLTLILLALLIKDSYPLKSRNVSKRFWISGFKIGYVLISSLLIGLVGLYLVSDALIRSGQVLKAFNFFPYFHWHQKIYESDPSLGEDERRRLFSIYQAHPRIYSLFITNEKNPEKKQLLKEKFVKIDPWQLVYQDLVGYYLDTENYLAAEEQLNLVWNFWQWAEGKSDYRVSYDKKMKLANQMWKTAEGFLNHRQLDKAIKWYLQAYSINQWQLNENEPIHIDETLNYQQQLEFFKQLSVVSGEHFGQHKGIYSQMYLDAVITSLKQEAGGEDLSLHMVNILKIAEWRRWELWEETSPLIFEKINLSISRRWYDQAYQQLNEIVKMWSLLSDNGKYYLELQNDNMAPAILSLIHQAANDGRYNEASTYTQLLGVVSQSQSHLTEQLVVDLQGLADRLVNDHEGQRAKNVIQVMLRVSEATSDGYWIIVQPANLSVLLGDYEEASNLYQICLDTFKFSRQSSHDDCYYGLRALGEGQFDPDRYWQVSQIIRDEAVWQDFVEE